MGFAYRISSWEHESRRLLWWHNWYIGR